MKPYINEGSRPEPNLWPISNGSDVLSRKHYVSKVVVSLSTLRTRLVTSSPCKYSFTCSLYKIISNFISYIIYDVNFNDIINML